MAKYPKLSTLTNTVTHNLNDNTLTFIVDDKQVTRKIKSEPFSNWSVDSVRVNNQRYLIDSGITHYLYA